MSERILFVDDDPNLLAACERNLRRRFQLDTAEGGELALEKIAAHGPYAVVVADMQMPRMDGVAFLSRVKDLAPTTVRIMLTGNANLETAIKVVNEGNIFRFLTKPCPPEILTKALDDALAQYRLVTAEKELLNNTLSGSIKLLTDILSMLDPQSFGRTQSVRDLVAEVAEQLGVQDDWELKLAVMLAPIGYVTIPPETLVKARAAQPLSKGEEQMLARVPETAARLLANIPRLESVAQIVRYQPRNFDGSGPSVEARSGTDLPYGSRLLRVLLDMVQLTDQGNSRYAALQEMAARQGWYDPDVLAAVRKVFGGQTADLASLPHIAVEVKDLTVGMVLHSNVYTKDGILILSAGHPINDMTLEKIENFQFLSGIREPIFVYNPTVVTS